MTAVSWLMWLLSHRVVQAARAAKGSHSRAVLRISQGTLQTCHRVRRTLVGRIPIESRVERILGLLEGELALIGLLRQIASEALSFLAPLGIAACSRDRIVGDKALLLSARRVRGGDRFGNRDLGHAGSGEGKFAGREGRRGCIEGDPTRRIRHSARAPAKTEFFGRRVENGVARRASDRVRASAETWRVIQWTRTRRLVVSLRLVLTDARVAVAREACLRELEVLAHPASVSAGGRVVQRTPAAERLRSATVLILIRRIADNIVVVIVVATSTEARRSGARLIGTIPALVIVVAFSKAAARQGIHRAGPWTTTTAQTRCSATLTAVNQSRIVRITAL